MIFRIIKTDFPPQELSPDKTAANAEQLLTYVGVARQPQSQSQDLRPADPVAWLKAACNDTRAKNRVNDSLEGIFDVKLPPDGPPTIDLHADEWGARR